MSILVHVEDVDPLEYELEINRNQIAGTARALARKRGATDRKLHRDDHELAVALWWSALSAGEAPPRDPEPRALTTAERRFVRRFLGA